MSSTTDANLISKSGEPRLRPELGPPQAWALLFWLNRAGAVRYRFRLLQGLALGLAIDEATVYWLGNASGIGSTIRVKLLASTLFFSIAIGIVAGWVLLGGWFDDPTRALFGQLGQRRGYSQSVCRYLETMASWRWLAGLMATPCLAFSVVAAVRIASLGALGAWAMDLLLALVFSQLAAACIVGAVVALRSLELKRARQIWLLACIVPEVIRPMLPGLPTLRILASTLEEALMRWGTGG